MKELELKILWENDNSFEMLVKPEGMDWIKIVRMEENGEIAVLWPHVQKICTTFLTQKLQAIGEEMST